MFDENGYPTQQNHRKHMEESPAEPMPVLARAYVPYQRTAKMFPLNQALKNGTVFPCLYQPYHPQHPGIMGETEESI